MQRSTSTASNQIHRLTATTIAHGILVGSATLALLSVFAPEIPFGVACGVGVAVGIMAWYASTNYQSALARKQKLKDKVNASSLSGADIQEELSPHAPQAVSTTQAQIAAAMQQLELGGTFDNLTQQSVRQAYRRVMHRVHPDKHQGKDQEFYSQLAVSIQQAHDLLIDCVPKN